MSTNNTRKEDMWAQSSTTTSNENRSPTSPPESTPATSPAKSNDGSSIATNEGSNSTKESPTPTSTGSTNHSGINSPDAEGLPHMPNVSRMSEYEEGTEFGGSSMLGGGHQEHADALTRALSRISLQGDTTPSALKTLNATTRN
ncbi:hypothetical protein V493_05593 [Pseudogymnoascus sp. VKM F-4281 (FW-2241)]|nr:hypothetical protein V493_05593 [Pseudogymnoascus sp. VKM F-4281 (FW-2241)]